MENPRSLMLKDYLKDYELSSCSSNGFRSFPRRQCCTTTTIRFLIQIHLKVKDSSSSSLTKRRNSSRKLAFAAVSKAVIRAFKQLPFPSVNRSRLRFLPRSLSRKFLPRSFWKREECEYTVAEPQPEVPRWKSFQEFLDDEKEFPVDPNSTVVKISTSSSSSSHSNNSNSWTESEFTSSVDSESYGENNIGKGGEDSNMIGGLDSEKDGEDFMEEATIAAASAISPEEITKQWRSDQEEKEQFSPISVLDFHFEDNSSSSFNCSLHLIEGNNQKMKRFENKAPEPINLQKRFEDQENQIETKAYELLKLVKSTTNSPCFIFQTENLLLDFFHEKLNSAGLIRLRLSEEEVLKLTEDWINNNGRGMVEMEWGLEEGRKVYVKDMEKWGDLREEKKELALEFEAQLWISLLNDLLFDLS